MASRKLNIVNPETLIYENKILKLTVLGGIKLEGLDRMRATLKVELKNSSVPPLRHNLDLYNDSQCEKLIRRAAEKLETGTSVLTASLSELTGQLEEYRLQQIKETAPKPFEPPRLNNEERKAAEAFLKAPDLLARTNELIGKSGVVGEAGNRLLMYLIFTSRKQPQPLHIVSLGASGTGKTHLQEKVGELIPGEDRIELTTLSENAFYYFERRALAHKLILIEDLDGAESSLFPLRELQSKRKISKTIAHKTTKGETKTLHLVVEGPVSVAGCTTKESIYEDNANRSFLIYLDESPEQDQQIMDYQRRASAGKIDKDEESKAAELLRNCQRLLEPVKVVNPYAELLCLPQAVFKPRRTNGHYLQFIEAVTFYHQWQREQKADTQTGEIFIETTPEDIAAANDLLKEILLRKSDELSGACRNYFERLKSWLQQEGRTTFTNREARTALRENHSNQKRYMTGLQQAGLIRKGRGNRKKGFYYEVVSMDEYRQLRQGITSVLDEICRNITDKPQKLNGSTASVVQGSEEVQRGGEPLKAVPGKESAQKFTLNEKRDTGVKKEGAQYTWAIVQQITANNPDQSFTVRQVSERTGRDRRTENRYLNRLLDKGLLQRTWENNVYIYQLIPQP